MLASSRIVGFVPSTDPGKARAFYEGVLGLRFVSQDQFALVLEANGTTVRVADVSSIPDFKPAPYTILGWEVTDIVAIVSALEERGVPFQRYPWMSLDELGIWSSPSGARVAWFTDPDGNVLSLTEH